MGENQEIRISKGKLKGDVRPPGSPVGGGAELEFEISPGLSQSRKWFYMEVCPDGKRGIKVRFPFDLWGSSMQAQHS